MMENHLSIDQDTLYELQEVKIVIKSCEEILKMNPDELEIQNLLKRYKEKMYFLSRKM